MSGAAAGRGSASSGAELFDFVRRAYPVCRSLTGPGVRATLAQIAEHIPLERREVPSGTPVLDWTAPLEWRPRAAVLRDAHGTPIADFAEHNLHLLGYSSPVDATMTLVELRPHLHTLPDRPQLIPYRTSYYQERWGFCLQHQRLERLRGGPCRVSIDTALGPGALSYGECVLPGRSPFEVLVSSHVCHPSLANDNLSGIAVAVALAAWLADRARRLTWRFVFAPGTIGAITWLAQHRELVPRIRYGLIFANLGDGGGFHYKRSRRGRSRIDLLAERSLAASSHPFTLEDFSPFGYDERQYCSPGFVLPVGCLSRTPWGRYPEYHTSADNLDLVRPAHLERSLAMARHLAESIEGATGDEEPEPEAPPPAGRGRRYLNLLPHGEPQLGRRGLYGSLGGAESGRERETALLWVLNLSDGDHGIEDIAERSRLPLPRLEEAARQLAAAGLLANS